MQQVCVNLATFFFVLLPREFRNVARSPLCPPIRKIWRLTSISGCISFPRCWARVLTDVPNCANHSTQCPHSLARRLPHPTYSLPCHIDTQSFSTFGFLIESLLSSFGLCWASVALCWGIFTSIRHAGRGGEGRSSLRFFSSASNTRNPA